MKDFVHAGEITLSAGLKKDAAGRLGSSAVATPWVWNPVDFQNAAGIDAIDVPLSAFVSVSDDLSADRPNSFYARHGKRILDISLIVLALPVILLVVGFRALCLLIEGGNPFYRQKRVGRDGRTFQILKLRTMVRDADALLDRLLENNPDLRREWMTTQKLKSDPRVTRVGAILRRTSLDELPQLWNVIRGDMSLVGPRPMMPAQMPLYGDARYYKAVRPGITGIWQVSLRNESRFEDRQDTDRAYYFKLSLLQDLKLLFQTVGVVVRGTGY